METLSNTDSFFPMDSLFIHSFDALCLLDNKGLVLQTNPSFFQLFGWNEDELIGRPLPFQHHIDVLKAPPEDVVEVDHLTIQRKDGSPVIVHMKALPPERNQPFFIVLKEVTPHSFLEKLDLIEQEHKETIRHQQGMSFKYKKIDSRFIHTLCDGDLIYRLGLGPEKVVGKELREFLPLETAVVKARYYERAWQGEENVMYEGEENGFTYLASLKPIKRDGSVVEVIASCVDITQRKCAEKALLEAEALYRCLVEDALVGVYLYQDGKIVYANPVFANIFGYTQSEMTTLDLIDLFVHEEQDYMMNKLTYGQEQDVKGSMNRDYKVRGVSKDGSFVDLEGNSTLTFFQGKPALIGTILDITERKETDRQYQRLLKLSPEPIMLHKDDIIIYVNDAGLQLFGTRDPLDLIGHSFIEQFHPHDQEHVRRKLDTVLKNDQSSGFSEFKLVRLDGNIVEVESSAIHIYKYMGESVIQSVFRDVTERKQAEEFMRRSEKLSLVGQMAAGVAHEIRNPLTSIKGFSQLLKEKNDTYKDYYEIMISELDRINEIVNEFMFLAKPNPVEFKKVKLSSILDHVISLMNTQAIINNVNIRVLYENDQVSINCDENQIKQVFINILKNAVESMPRGGDIIIDCNTSPEQDEVYVRFIDQGTGIPEDRLKKIGEPFYTTKEQGTGLGLMLSYKIIESHKGKMNIQSELHKGTLIEIVLPNRKPKA